MAEPGGAATVRPRRWIGLVALTLLAAMLVYQVLWHVLDSSWPGIMWLIAAGAAVIATILAVARLRDAGPRWDLRALLVLLVVALGSEWVGSLLAYADVAVTDSVTGYDSVRPRWWSELPVLVPAVVALVGSWPTLRLTGRAQREDSG